MDSSAKYQAIFRAISRFRGVSRWKMLVFPGFFSNKRRKLFFVNNVLNNKTIILLRLAEHHLILANSNYGLVG